MNYLNERFLCFKYDDAEVARKLSALLYENKIDHVIFVSYTIECFIRKSGKTWAEVMRLVNSVQARKYSYQKKSFYIKDKPYSIGEVLGNVQLVSEIFIS